MDGNKIKEMEKTELLKHAASRFTKFGSKRFTLDELANELGISKKTIYKHFKNKEDLVAESVNHLLEEVISKLNAILEDKDKDAIQKIIWIYKICFNYLKEFKPSFINGLKKYYPKADVVFEGFRSDVVHQMIYYLLVDAKENNIIRNDVDIKLVSQLYFLRVDNVVFKSDNLFSLYSSDVLLDHLIINNLKGIVNSDYKVIY